MCCFRRKRSSTTGDTSRTAPFASSRNACPDTIELVRPDKSLSFEAHSMRACDTPEDIIESVGGRLVIPHPEGLDWRDELDNEELVTRDYHKNLEAGWDKEFESFARRRDKEREERNDGKGTLPRSIAKSRPLARTDMGAHSNLGAKPLQQRALFPSKPPTAYAHGHSRMS